ncbi:ETEC_3214 domain-containing protein [Gordonia terrae]
MTIVDDRTPQLSTEKKQIQRHLIHRLRAAWVTTEFHEDALIAFSVTITDPSMHYRIDRQTHGLIRGRLGKDAVDGISTEGSPQGVFAWLGARSTGYIEHYYFGNPGGYQQYWLSSNPIGAGQMTLPPPSEYRTGTYASRGGPQPSTTESPNRAEIPANTITVLGPNAPSEAVGDMLNRWTHGAENDVVRLDVSDVRRPKRPRRRVLLSLSARNAASE